MFKRGFKSQCERRAVEFRRQLGLPAISPLSAISLANYLGITIWSLHDVNGLSETDAMQLVTKDGSSWSAFTLRKSERHLIVFNPSQSEPRINSVCMHELSHIILGHKLHDAGISDEGLLVPSNYHKEQEDAADWLGGTLLLPRPALLSLRERKLSDPDIKIEYQVSQQMITWRFRMTGVDVQLRNRSRSKAESR